MNSFNTIARLGKDAELRYLPDSNTPVLQFTAAFDSGYGENKTTTWLQCALFGKRATDKLASYLTKGTQVGLSGEIKLDEWQGREGVQKTLKMRVNDLTLLSKPQHSDNSPPADNEPPF